MLLPHSRVCPPPCSSAAESAGPGGRSRSRDQGRQRERACCLPPHNQVEPTAVLGLASSMRRRFPACAPRSCRPQEPPSPRSRTMTGTSLERTAARRRPREWARLWHMQTTLPAPRPRLPTSRGRKGQTELSTRCLGRRGACWSHQLPRENPRAQLLRRPEALCVQGPPSVTSLGWRPESGPHRPPPGSGQRSVLARVHAPPAVVWLCCSSGKAGPALPVKAKTVAAAGAWSLRRLRCSRLSARSFPELTPQLAPSSHKLLPAASRGRPRLGLQGAHESPAWLRASPSTRWLLGFAAEGHGVPTALTTLPPRPPLASAVGSVCSRQARGGHGRGRPRPGIWTHARRELVSCLLRAQKASGPAHLEYRAHDEAPGQGSIRTSLHVHGWRPAG